MMRIIPIREGTGSPLRVVHLHAGIRESGGGSGFSMFRLHQALRGRGIDSRILVHRMAEPEAHVDALPRVTALGLEDRLEGVCSWLGLNDLHRLGSFLLPRHRWFQDADVVHVHCAHSGAISYLALPFLAARKPTVFTLHDMWAVTGHCAFSFGCERWKAGCGECPYPEVHPAVERDASAVEWRLKQWTMSRARVTFIAQSEWMRDRLAESFLRHHPATLIPQSVDVESFRPVARAEARAQLGIPEEVHVLMTAALNLERWRQGGDLLRVALERLPEEWKRRLVLLTMGHEANGTGRNVGIRTRNLGFVAEEDRRALAYSASDLFVMPSRTGMTSNVLTESLACGTPVVAFRVGGVPEVVRPGLTGDLAEPGDSEGLSRAIAALLEDDARRNVMRRACREAAVGDHALDLQVARHLSLYRILTSRDAPTAIEPPPHEETPTVSAA